MRYYLIDRNRTRYIGPFFSVLEVKAHVLEESGITDFKAAVKFMGLEVVVQCDISKEDK